MLALGFCAVIFVLAVSAVARITSPYPEWAGAYIQTPLQFDGEPAPEHFSRSGFSYVMHGCFGPSDLNSGSLEERRGRLMLKGRDPGQGAEPVSEVLIPVRWGQRSYLVGENQIRVFANAVNAGTEPCGARCTMFLVRESEFELPVEGLPALPKEYRKLLLGKPLLGEIVRVLDVTSAMADPHFNRKWRTTTVEINRGKLDGVWEGMEFFSESSRYPWPAFTVVQVGEDSSIAVLQEFDPQDAVPQAGACVSTRFADSHCGSPGFSASLATAAR